MLNPDLSEINKLHSEWSKLDNATKLGWLTGVKMSLDRLANQLAQSIKANGGFINDEERTFARQLLEMIDTVNADGHKVLNDLRNDAFKEIYNRLL